MNRKDARKIAKTITNEQIQQIFNEAKTNIKDWIKVSSVNELKPEKHTKQKELEKKNKKQRTEIKKLKGQVEELEIRLRLKKLHCKFFHRLKFSIWISTYWVRLNIFFKTI